MTNQQAFFVSSAVVAGRLLTVMQIAKEISLAAKNAKAIAERAGEKASSFKPITDFIDEMGRETLDLVDAINYQALVVSRHAVTEMRANEANDRFKHAKALYGDGEKKRLHAFFVEQSMETLEEHHKSVRSEARILLDLLDKITSCMRASGVISTRSRVEAVGAGDYQGSLEMVAETVERASDEIKDIVRECEQMLHASM